MIMILFRVTMNSYLNKVNEERLKLKTIHFYAPESVYVALKQWLF